MARSPDALLPMSEVSMTFDSSTDDPSTARRGVLLLFAATIFCSAFLLFQVQPLISRFILPWFGGSPAVWSTCMLFFQVVLFAGYLYAHLTSTKLSPRWQAIRSEEHTSELQSH